LKSHLVSVIERESGFRSVRVFGDLDDSETTAAELVALIDEEILPKVLERLHNSEKPTDIKRNFIKSQC